MQEDAYITLRTAYHLADFGDYSYNIGSQVSGVTSLSYGVIVAGLRVLFKGWTPIAVQILGSLCVVGGAKILATSCFAPGVRREIFWVGSATLPTALLASYSGMETPLLMLACCLALKFLRDGNVRALPAVVFALPLIRPDAISYGAILSLCIAIVDPRAAIRTFAALGVGVATLVACTWLQSGEWVTTTAVAKQLSYHPDHTIAAIAKRIQEVLFADSFVSPYDSDVIKPLKPVFGAVFLIAAALFLLRTGGWNWRGAFALAMVTSAIAVPSAYAVGGVIFPWYLWPSAWLGQMVILLLIIDLWPKKFGRRTNLVAISCAAVFWVGLASIRYGLSYRAGTVQACQGEAVGRFIAQLASPGATLWLEPAGVIPFYAGVRTVDEIGLVSPEAVNYRKLSPTQWWIRYVEENEPDFIVQRTSFKQFVTYQGYHLSEGEKAWFSKHYRLVGDFRHDRILHQDLGLVQRLLLEHGAAEGDMLVYLRDSARTSMSPEQAIAATAHHTAAATCATVGEALTPSPSTP